MKKVLSVILTAAMLLTTACADISTSQGNQSGVIGDTSGGVTESVGGNTVVENTPNKVDDTLPQCEPANLPGVSGDFSHSVMKGRDGYYYTAVLWSNDRESYVLNYYDLATGKSIPLCAKPQCMHDGNAFCTATGGGLFVDDVYESLYDGYIYKLGFIESDEAKCTLSVLKADLQGNELSKVADVFTAPLSDDDLLLPKIRSVVFHYGKMFVSMFTSKGTAKTSLYVIDLASGEVKEIVLSSPEKGTTEWIGATCSYMTADGDWLYYTMRNYKLDNSGVESEEHMTYNRTVLYRYNIKSGETEMVSAMPDIYSSFSVADGIVYYTVADRKENTFSLYSYDIEKDKITTLADRVQQEFVQGKYIGQRQKVTVVTDKKYLYVCTRGLTGNYSKGYEATSDDIDFYIYDLKGNMLLHGMPGLDMSADNYAYGFSALDGEIYICYQDHNEWNSGSDENIKSGMYKIKTADLVNGSTDWQKLYTAMR